MPFAATVYSLLLATSLSTPAIEELNAIRQKELTEEEIAAQIEENRVERVRSQFDSRETPIELEDAAAAETRSNAAAVIRTASQPRKPSTGRKAASVLNKKASPGTANPSAPAVQNSPSDYLLIAPPTLSRDLLPPHFEEELPGDQDILLALKAAQNADVTKLKTLAARVQRHPLGSYVELWEINALAEQSLKQTNKLSPNVEQRYDRFIRTHADQYLAERARTDWLRYAASANDARRFAALYPLLKWNQQERDILCMRQSFALDTQKSEANVLFNAKKLLLHTTSPQIEACRNLAAKTLQADHNWTWQYLLILLQKKRYALAAELVKDTPAKYLPIGKQELSQMLANPEHWMKRNRKLLPKKSPRLLIAASLRMVQKNPEAAERLAQAADNRLDASARALLWGRLGYEAALRQNPKSLAYYKRAGQFLKSAPSSTLIVNGSTLLAWQARAALRHGTPAQVLSAIAQLPVSMQKADNWTYWKARMLDITGHRQQARSMMQSLARGYEFYNLLAADYLGQSYYKGPESVSPPPSRESFRRFSQNPSVQRAVRFYALGLPYEGHREWNWALTGMKNRTRLELAEYAGALNLDHRRINTAASVGRAAAFNQLYPKPLEEKIEQAAKAAGLSSEWVFGLIRQESRFIRLALSSAGARGLMQVMPATARWVAQQTGLKNFKTEQLSDIDTNLFLGTQYLRLVRENISPNVTLATASYNAGPSRAIAWRASLVKEVEGALFAETIPFTETRDYVMRVTANTVQYSRYTNSPLRLTELLGRIAPQPPSSNIIP